MIYAETHTRSSTLPVFGVQLTGVGIAEEKIEDDSQRQELVEKMRVDLGRDIDVESGGGLNYVAEKLSSGEVVDYAARDVLVNDELVRLVYLVPKIVQDEDLKIAWRMGEMMFSKNGNLVDQLGQRILGRQEAERRRLPMRPLLVAELVMLKVKDSRQLSG